MARLFERPSGEYLKNSTAVVSGVPFAVVLWFNLDTDAINPSMFTLCNNAGLEIYSVVAKATFAGNPIEVGVYSGTWQVARTTTGITIDQWHHCTAIFASDSDRRALIDGGSKATNTATEIVSTVEKTIIGASSSEGNTFSGMIAEVAIYDLSALPGATGSDKADYFEANILPGLAAGEPPSKYPTGLTAYWPFETSSLDDEADDFDLIAEGTTFVYDHPSVYRYIGGSVDGQSTLTGNLQWLQELAGLISGQSALAGNIDSLLVFSLAGLISSQSSLVGDIDSILVFNLAGLISNQSTLAGNINAIEILNGQIAAQAALTAKLQDLGLLSGSLASQSSLTGALGAIESLIGDVSAQSSLSAFVQIIYALITPAMHKDLIDPYSGGAWLWLVEIVIPGQTTQRIARNTAEVIYGSITFPKGNFDPPKQSSSGDGSVPKVVLRVAQDRDHILENIINASKGGTNGTVKIVRTCEKFLDTPVAELEADFDILTAGSNTEWVIFSLGMPSPLIQRIPLWLYSSKICPYATPSLFKGVRCQYTGADPTCTGLLEDCFTKGNIVHWGAEVGLDPNAVRV